MRLPSRRSLSIRTSRWQKEDRGKSVAVVRNRRSRRPERRQGRRRETFRTGRNTRRKGKETRQQRPPFSVVKQAAEKKSKPHSDKGKAHGFRWDKTIE